MKTSTKRFLGAVATPVIATGICLSHDEQGRPMDGGMQMAIGFSALVLFAYLVGTWMDFLQKGD